MRGTAQTFRCTVTTGNPRARRGEMDQQNGEWMQRIGVAGELLGSDIPTGERASESQLREESPELGTQSNCQFHLAATHCYRLCWSSSSLTPRNQPELLGK